MMVDANAEEFSQSLDSSGGIAVPLSTATIFSVGKDEGILRRRQEEIQTRAGMRVRWMQAQEAEILTRTRGKRLWMFCATLDSAQAMYLACSVRRYSPESRLLLLSEQEPPRFEMPLFDEVVLMPASMESIVSAVRRLARG